ncbi:MAG: polymerase sigma factor RpoE [Myxococcaceae bacterium]|nr:polymerase sigma factor RpoE [Myxococcaceae bacterium]
MPASLDSAALFRQYASFVARFLTRLGVAPCDLDDVLQEVFLVVHARGGYVAGPAKPTSYLGAIAARAASSYRRRRGTSGLRATAILPDELSTERPDPVQTLQQSELARALQRALTTLDPVLCTTLLLVDHEGESCSSVAASMDAPIGTVYWRLHKARKALRVALAAQGERMSSSTPLSNEVR